MAFYFSKPADFVFKAGQYVQLSLVEPPETDDDGDIRTLSIASAPFEKELLFAMRMRDKAFKRVLKNMTPGSSVKIDGPFGNLVLHDDISRPAVFLVGGIGITPVFSILKQSHHENKSHRIFLFYSNPAPKDAAFLDELKALDQDWEQFRLVATMTRPEKSDSWQGERGKISGTLLKKYLDDFSKPVFYVVGSLDMVLNMTGMLRGLGVEENLLKYEEFIGY
ncbi:MAG: FAD-dependent oxidoreductase [candidate division Zixibacteria bacterium]|nr:FAD-dependent oxidoreductase [candidate division Zixibacteria bacterium]